MTQVRAVAIAAFFCGLGMAGEPFQPLRALIAGAIVLAVSFILDRRVTPLGMLIFGFLSVLFAYFVQHLVIDPNEGFVYVVPLAVGVLGAASMGRRSAPPVVAGLGAIAGTAFFFLQ